MPRVKSCWTSGKYLICVYSGLYYLFQYSGSLWFCLWRFYGPVNPMGSCGENDRRKYFMINLHERMLPTSVGVEPATSWSPVGRHIQLSHQGRRVTMVHYVLTNSKSPSMRDLWKWWGGVTCFCWAGGCIDRVGDRVFWLLVSCSCFSKWSM